MNDALDHYIDDYWAVAVINASIGRVKTYQVHVFESGELIRFTEFSCVATAQATYEMVVAAYKSGKAAR